MISSCELEQGGIQSHGLIWQRKSQPRRAFRPHPGYCLLLSSKSAVRESKWYRRLENVLLKGEVQSYRLVKCSQVRLLEVSILKENPSAPLWDNREGVTGKAFPLRCHLVKINENLNCECH